MSSRGSAATAVTGPGAEAAAGVASDARPLDRDDHRARVCLVHPPLISLCLDCYHPAIAMLAAFLGESGIAARQWNLNAEFARFLLDDAVLRQLGAGDFAAPGGSRERALRQIGVRGHAQALSRGFAAASPSGGDRYRDADAATLARLARLAEALSVDLSAAELVRDPPDVAMWTGLIEAFARWSALPTRLLDDIGLIGISVSMSIQLLPALVLARWFKAQRPDARVVLGGPTLSFLSAEDHRALFAWCPALDATVRYDGEFPLRALARQVLSGDWAPADVGAVVSPDGAGGVIDTPPTPGPRLDDLPMPAYDPEILAGLRSPWLAITQARGCYWGRCAYCDYFELYQGSGKYRTRRVDGFVAEVREQIRRHGVRRFTILTDSLPPAFAARMSAAFIEQKLDVRWESFVMVDRRFTRELLTRMRRAGCWSLTLGLETLTDRVLRLVDKQADQAGNLRFLDDARAAGIRLRVNLIPNLPSTTYDEAMQTLALLRDYQDLMLDVGVFPLEVTRSSGIGRAPEAFGLRVRPSGPETAQNRIEFEDAAMAPEHRAEVIAAYRAFSREVAARRAAG